jgi:hypothetical protein
VQRPLGTLVVAKLFVPAGPRHLVGLELDVAHGSDVLHGGVRTSREKRGVKPLAWRALVSMKVGRL